MVRSTAMHHAQHIQRTHICKTHRAPSYSGPRGLHWCPARWDPGQAWPGGEASLTKQIGLLHLRPARQKLSNHSGRPGMHLDLKQQICLHNPITKVKGSSHSNQATHHVSVWEITITVTVCAAHIDCPGASRTLESDQLSSGSTARL